MRRIRIKDNQNTHLAVIVGRESVGKDTVLWVKQMRLDRSQKIRVGQTVQKVTVAWS